MRALEQEVQQLKAIIAYLDSIISRTKRYARHTYLTMSARMEAGGMEPRDYNFARGAAGVAGQVLRLLSG